jgi:N utilization substance protein B
MSDRRLAREVAVQTLYEITHTEAPYAAALAANVERRAANPAVQAYADRLLRTVVAHRDEIAAKLAEAVENWSLERVAMVDRCVLEVACAEILWFEDVPSGVAIAEAIDVARKFSTDESGGFVNGVLDRIARAQAPGGG